MKPKPRLRIRVKRAYDAPARSDGRRVLVDRMWPRGVSKDAALLDAWAKELAPSTGLRTWFAHDPAKWPSFKLRYLAELTRKKAAVAELLAGCERATLTLVFGAKDLEHNNAVVLKEYLERHSLGANR
jgi:uncharacterized protein YeaO (DUF488 family)